VSGRSLSAVAGALLITAGGCLSCPSAYGAGQPNLLTSALAPRATCADPYPIPFEPSIQPRFTTGTAPLTVVIDTSVSTGPCPIVSRTINFGDRSPDADVSSTLKAAHAYAKPGAYRVTLTETESTGATASVTSTIILGGLYAADGPQRILDTRVGTGAAKRPLPAGGTIRLKVTGRDAVPATGVTAVVLNLTATAPTGAGAITAHPDGTRTPNAANLDFTRGQTVSNLVTVPVTANGTIDLTNSSGESTNLLADLQGYYTVAGAPGAGFYDDANPTVRLLDTRQHNAVHNGPLDPGQSITLPVANQAAANPGASAPAMAMLRITATAPTAAGFVTVSNRTGAPSTATVNFAAGQTTTDLAIVPLDANGAVHLYNHTGRTHVVVDLLGTFTTTAGLFSREFTPLAPERLLGAGAPVAKLHPGQYLQVNVPQAGEGVPITSVLLNVTATDATASTYLNVFSWATTMAPPAPFATLDLGPGQTVSTLTESSVATNYSGTSFDVLNHSG